MNKILLLFCFPLTLLAQERLDGISAVVGDQIILDSDIREMKRYVISQGGDMENTCSFIDKMLLEKTLTYQAKQDTLIQQNITEESIQQNVDARVSYFLNQVGGKEERLLKEFGLNSMADLQEEMYRVVEDQAYTDAKRQSILADIDVSPEELKAFYNKNKYDLPDVNEEVEISHILLYPKLSDMHKQELIDKLNNIKKDIIEGKSNFADEAKLYSEDPGSAKEGGLYERVPRGKMVKEFDAVAFNLEEGEISDPFETDFGFHIVKLEKRRGQLLDLRHILLKAEPNEDEVKMAKHRLDSIKTLIKDSTYTFREAVYKFSEDKYTRYNSGVISDPNTGESKIEKTKLNTNEYFAIAGLKPDTFTDVFEDDYQEGSQVKKAVRFIYLKDIIPAHKLSMDQDYDRIKKYAVEEKKQSVLEKYIESKIPETNIEISKQYKDCTFTYDWLQEDIK